MAARARTLVLLLALGAAGCAVSDGVSPQGPGFDEFGCQVGCARCPPEAACVSSPYEAVCRQACLDTAACPTGQTCAIVDGAANGSPVCLAPRSLTVCHDAPCSLAPRCKDAKTALVPLPAGFGICGWEMVACDSGCDPMVGNCK